MVGTAFRHLFAPGPIFVIGTGRSGTHWLGYSLRSHPEVRVTVEAKPMFQLSTRMAINPSLEEQLFRRLVLEYRRQLLISAFRIYVDKTHPNIWMAEKLKRAFPNSRFIGIERNPYATVASMMKHRGVSAWHKRWREFPIPNRFLGITVELAEVYDEIPFAAQCAMRWVAHHERMCALASLLGDSLLVISYEALALNTETILQELQEFMGLTSDISVPEVRSHSLVKWKEQLSSEQVEQIQNTVGFPPDTDS